MSAAASTYGVPAHIIAAVMGQESGGNANAVSPAGAVGAMQLMPGTASQMGVTDRKDRWQSVMGGTRYLAQMLQRYGGNLALALAAYNAGPGAVDKYGGVPPFAETQAYVRGILGKLNG